MNSSGWIRGYMSKSYGSEDFLLHVGRTIEKQLKEWNENYHVNIMKFKDYWLVVRIGEQYYEVTFTEEELAQLQGKSPFALDYKIWTELAEKGLEILTGYGDYLRKVL